jgi:hypothetical protein
MADGQHTARGAARNRSHKFGIEIRRTGDERILVARPAEVKLTPEERVDAALRVGRAVGLTPDERIDAAMRELQQTDPADAVACARALEILFGLLARGLDYPALHPRRRRELVARIARVRSAMIEPRLADSRAADIIKSRVRIVAEGKCAPTALQLASVIEGYEVTERRLRLVKEAVARAKTTRRGRPRKGTPRALPAILRELFADLGIPFSEATLRKSRRP